MCRLFGFRSVIPSQVHRSLLVADNALGVQSNMHPDGWGVAYYIDGTPHITRSPTTAVSDNLFHRLSGVVASETVLAHVRKATVGNKTVFNCHPFQFGRWVFAHNGEIPNFSRYKETLVAEIAPRLRRFILGETDSEIVFFMFLTQLLGFGPLASRHGVQEATEALQSTIKIVRQICDGSDQDKLWLTLMVTDGTTLVAAHGGKELFWSSHKTRCADRDSCPNLAPECEAPSKTGFINHLILSSEPLLGENVWNEMKIGETIGVDWRMCLYQTKE